MDELFQMMFGGTKSWVEAAYLTCLFWIVLTRPEKIRSLLLFRLACVTFAATLLIPAVVRYFLMGEDAMMFMRRGPVSTADSQLGMILMLFSPLLFAASFLMAIDSVTPRRRGRIDQASADEAARRE